VSSLSVGILTGCVLIRVGRPWSVSCAERLTSSALWNFLGTRVSASAMADLVRVKSTLIPLANRRFTPLCICSAVLSFPYTVEEGRDNRGGAHTIHVRKLIILVIIVVTILVVALIAFVNFIYIYNIFSVPLEP
jgi:heme/copper-type cytochrome/quinol oxidase subunit 2